MAGAMMTVKVGKGYLGGYELDVILLVIAIYLVINSSSINRFKNEIIIYGKRQGSDCLKKETSSMMMSSFLGLGPLLQLLWKVLNGLNHMVELSFDPMQQVQRYDNRKANLAD